MSLAPYVGRYDDPTQAEHYAKYRPRYPCELYGLIWEYCGIQPGCRQPLAVDLCCGTGISSRPLAEHFDRVIGIDISQAQIDIAQTDLQNVKYCLGPTEDLSFLPDECVDLITCATGMHWLNREKLFSEVERVLRPCGVFVAYAHGLFHLDNVMANQYLQEVRKSWSLIFCIFFH